MREKFILDLLTVMAGQIGKNQRKFFLALAHSHNRKICIHQKDVLTRPECVSKIVSTLNQLLSYCDENPKKKKIIICSIGYFQQCSLIPLIPQYNILEQNWQSHLFFQLNFEKSLLTKTSQHLSPFLKNSSGRMK